MSDMPPGPHPSPAVIAESARRAGLLWIAVPGHGRPRPAWHVWCTPRARAGDAGDGAGLGAAYVLTGPGEQPLPGLTGASRAEVTIRAGQGGPAAGLVTWTAEVGRVEPGSAEWDDVIGALLAGRLNPAPPRDGVSLAQRWSDTCAVFRLRPTSG